jgi:hypothetical protein
LTGTGIDKRGGAKMHPTTRLNTGHLVLARADGNALTYSNRTQAEKKAADVYGYAMKSMVTQSVKSRRFFVLSLNTH